MCFFWESTRLTKFTQPTTENRNDSRVRLFIQSEEFILNWRQLTYDRFGIMAVLSNHFMLNFLLFILDIVQGSIVFENFITSVNKATGQNNTMFCPVSDKQKYILGSHSFCFPFVYAMYRFRLLSWKTRLKPVNGLLQRQNNRFLCYRFRSFWLNVTISTISFPKKTTILLLQNHSILYKWDGQAWSSKDLFSSHY